MPWVPPSAKSLEKLPMIEIVGSSAQKYLDWIDAHPEIPRTVPPVMLNFVVKHSREFYDPQIYHSHRTHNYIEIVHYADNLTALDVCHMIDGKKALILHSRYVDYNGLTVHAELQAPSTSKYKPDWLRSEGIAALYTVLAVQAYILYHRPDIAQTVISDATASRRSSKQNNSSPAPRKIADAKRKIIRLTENDTPPAAKNYRALQWQVRGHYRRYTRKDGSQYMIYIKPHLAKRGEKNKKTATPKYVLENRQEK